MVLCKKRWYYEQNYDTIKKYENIPRTIELFTKEKSIVVYQKLRNFIIEKKIGNIPTQLKFLNKFIALELWFTIENYGTMDKNYIWYHTEKYGTIQKTIELCFTMDKTMALWTNYGTIVNYS